MPPKGAFISTGSLLEQWANSITTAEIETLLPTGLRTPEALIVRKAVYDPTPITKVQDLLDYCKHHRNDPEYIRGIGHKRAVWICSVAVFVRIMLHKGDRLPTQKMFEMVNEAFPEDFTERFVLLLMQPHDTRLDWHKDDPQNPKRIMVPSAVARNPDIINWVATPWAKLTPFDEKKVDAEREAARAARAQALITAGQPLPWV